MGEYSVSLTLADESGNSKQVEVPVLVGTEPTFWELRSYRNNRSRECGLSFGANGNGQQWE